MDLKVTVSEAARDALEEIAKLKKCSVDLAARIVLENYSERTKRQIKSAYKAADKV